MRRFGVTAAFIIVALALSGNALASQLVDRNATGVKLEANTNGKALLVYRAHGAAAARARVGRDERALPEHDRAAGEVQARLLGRTELAGLHEHVPAVQRSGAPERRRRVHAPRRLVLGCTAVGAAAPGSRLRPVDGDAEREVARDLTLAGADPDAERVHRLGVERPLPGSVRRVHVRRASRCTASARPGTACRPTRTGD